MGRTSTLILIVCCWANLVVPLSARGQTLAYSSFLGGAKEDGGRAYLTADNGSIIVASSTRSSDFPVTLASTPPSGGTSQISVTRLDPAGGGAGDLVWSLTYGGSTDERVRGIEIDGAGNIYVSGITSASDFPTTDGSSGPGVFALALTSTGSRIYATVLGEAGDPADGGLAVDAAGNAYLTGSTASASFPDTLGTGFAGGAYDAFVTKLDPSGAIVYSRLLGGAGGDGGRSIAVDASGGAYLLGISSSADFPVTAGAFQSQLAGTVDAFVAALDATGALSAATYLGGGDEEMGREGGIALGPQGTVWTTGRTLSNDFPTANAWDATANGNTEGFVAQLAADLGSLLYATYLGGTSGERGTCIAVDAAGIAYVGGRTLSSDFPATPDAFDPSLDGRHEGFFTLLDSTGSGSDTLVLSSFLGGSRDDGPVCLELGTDGGGNTRAYMTGLTASRTDFPLTPGAYDESYNGGKSDISVTVFDFVATPDPVCGNGVIEAGEVCDGGDLGGETCGDQLGCVGGVLLCNATCDAFDTALCTGSNAVREGSEECDDMDFGVATCGDFGCGGGNLTCNADCTVDASSCLACCAEVDQSCVKDSDCCSLNCSNGPPSSRVCLP